MERRCIQVWFYLHSLFRRHQRLLTTTTLTAPTEIPERNDYVLSVTAGINVSGSDVVNRKRGRPIKYVLDGPMSLAAAATMPSTTLHSSSGTKSDTTLIILMVVVAAFLALGIKIEVSESTLVGFCYFLLGGIL
ncbi:hypothetical protein L6452_04177 [Arctium lappa]|uniref:Uncharacterized protein n=1 Tax=Arctium lappa TaxID=4217 RepID=A0ACB9FQ70_ARCLA|nr:hypothetical protein L6452_04177 [Arctium lappa]